MTCVVNGTRTTQAHCQTCHVILLDSVVLVEVTPLSDKMLFQVVDVAGLGMADELTECASHFVVDWIKVSVI